MRKAFLMVLALPMVLVGSAFACDGEKAAAKTASAEGCGSKAAVATTASAGESCGSKAASAKTASAEGCGSKAAVATTASAGGSCGSKAASAKTASADGCCPGAKAATAQTASAGGSCGSKAAPSAATAGASCGSKAAAKTADAECADKAAYTYTYVVSGMTCGGCASKVEGAVKQAGADKIAACAVDYEKGSVVVSSESELDGADIAKAITDAGFPAELAPEEEKTEAEADEEPTATM